MFTETSGKLDNKNITKLGIHYSFYIQKVSAIIITERIEYFLIINSIYKLYKIYLTVIRVLL